ncbi:D-lactate dehydrogenase VanH-D [Extibacter muris]|uniref:D-lactate dehydrogenase VanH-D n=1 Tax=Extibacter muris TaxID=1796622 RepID=A0A4R4FCI6_9FIRM|nr:D-lactate dehydrogenase VanH-D [Extibacter muris]MCU0080417.1 D-lactate dehydrogenase VanH-D [Extibacter muris]TDA21001.1 D-lactate dehydrogenase VanH-D [Extibacter muris]
MKKKTDITVFGCEMDEAAVFYKLSCEFGVTVSLISEAVSENNAKLAAGCQCVSISHKAELSEPLLLALKNAGVKYICTRSIGFNHIDIQAAGQMGITVGTVAYSPGSVADYAIMLMLMLMRGTKPVMHRAEIQNYCLNNLRGKELQDMTVGVIGTGRIGQAVMERLKGFGCTVLAYDRNHKAGAGYVSFCELLQSSDIITLHVPLAEDSFHMIGREQLNMMKKEALLINTARGALVDTGALIDALEDGRIGGAALDVLEGEEGIFYYDYTHKALEHPFLSALQRMPNVIVTPHTAYHTERVLVDTVSNTIRNCLNFERSLGNV